MAIPFGQQMMPTQEPGPRAGRSDLPVDLSEIPTPAQAPINVSPAALQPSHADMPPGAGYMGTSGKIAALASNFLHGWLQGKAAKEAKMVRDATNEVQGAKGAFDLVQNSFNNLVQMGASDNPEWQKANPELAQKYATTKQAMMQSWQNYIGSMEKYALPQAPDGGPVKKGVGGKIKEALLPQGPALYAQKSIEFLKSLDPTTLVTQSPDSLQKLANVQTSQENAKQEALKTSTMTLGTKEAQTAYNMRDAFDRDSQQYNQLASKTQRSPQEQQQMEVLGKDLDTQAAQLASRGVKVVTPQQIALGRGKEELEATTMQMKTEAVKKLQNGQPLTWNEQVTLGVQPKDLLDVYLQAYPGSPLVAVKKMQEANIEAQKAIYGWKSPIGQLEQQIRTANPGWNDEQVAGELVRRLHPTAPERAGYGDGKGQPMDPAKLPIAQSDIAKLVINAHPELAKYGSYPSGKKDGDGNQMMIYGVNATAAPRKGILGFGADDPEAFKAGKEQFQTLMWQAALASNYPDYQARQIAGLVVPGETVSEPPQVQPAEGKGAAKAAGAAQAAAQASQNQAGGFTYSIRTPDGKVQTKRVATREDVEKARAQAKQKGHIFTEVKNTNQ